MPHKCYLRCQFCGKGCRDPSKYNRHVRLPHKKCHKCGKFYLSSFLTSHLLHCEASDSGYDTGSGYSSVTTASTPSEDGSPSNGATNPDAITNGHADPTVTSRCSTPVSPGGFGEEAEESVDNTKIAIAEYLRKARLALEELKKKVEQDLKTTPPETRDAAELPIYREILHGGSLGTPITLEEYWQSTWTEPTDNFVVCSKEEARELLERGPPLLPILIPSQLNRPDSDNRITFEEACQLLNPLGTVDLQLSHGTGNKKDEPVRLKSADAIRILCNHEKNGPSNAINLRCWRDNPVPSCLCGLHDYKLMVNTGVDNGKPGAHRTDWEAAAQFGLLGSEGALSLWHIDRGGVITTVFCESGKKWWSLRPGVQVKHVEDFCRQGDPKTLNQGAVHIYMTAGDQVIQPQGTWHAPYSPEKVSMTGTMHLHPDQIPESLRLAQLELEHRDITNEDFSEQYIPLMEEVLEMWKDNKPPYKWDTPERLQEAKQRLKVSSCV